MYTVAPPTCFTGRSFSVSTTSGEELVRTLYSIGPIFAVPAGRMTLDRLKPMVVDYTTLASLLETLSRGYLKTWVDRQHQ